MMFISREMVPQIFFEGIKGLSAIPRTSTGIDVLVLHENPNIDSQAISKFSQLANIMWEISGAR